MNANGKLTRGHLESDSSNCCDFSGGFVGRMWKDVWNNNHLNDAFPRLFSFAKNQDISVVEFLQNNIIEDQFHTPLSTEAFQEYQELQNLIQNLQIQENEKDKWHYIWGQGFKSPAIARYSYFRHGTVI